LGCLFWLAFIILVAVLFVFNKDNISNTLTETHFMERVFGGKDKEVPDQPPATTSPNNSIEPQGNDTPGQESDLVPPQPADTAPSARPGEAETQEPKVVIAPVEKKQSPTTIVSQPQPSQEIKQEERAKQEAPKGRSRVLWFVRVASDGSLDREKANRAMPVSDSPLSDVIEALLKGPSKDEEERGLTSLLPVGTKLLSATVRGTTAYLNFSEEFQFNSFGIEGYASQLKQVVLTATEFPTVQDVQILIEGRRHDFLGPEGIWIGAPLSRQGL